MKMSVVEIDGMLSLLSVDETEMRIGEVPGVESVTVNLAPRRATVRYDETQIELARIKSPARQRGYEQDEFEAATAAKPAAAGAAAPQTPAAAAVKLAAAAAPQAASKAAASVPAAAAAARAAAPAAPAPKHADMSMSELPAGTVAKPAAALAAPGVPA